MACGPDSHQVFSRKTLADHWNSETCRGLLRKKCFRGSMPCKGITAVGRQHVKTQRSNRVRWHVLPPDLEHRTFREQMPARIGLQTCNARQPWTPAFAGATRECVAATALTADDEGRRSHISPDKRLSSRRKPRPRVSGRFYRNAALKPGTRFRPGGGRGWRTVPRKYSA